MYSIIKHDDNIAYNVNEYVCDSINDLNSLPRCAPGSTAVVLEASGAQVYMKNTEGKWVKV